MRSDQSDVGREARTPGRPRATGKKSVLAATLFGVLLIGTASAGELYAQAIGQPPPREEPPPAPPSKAPPEPAPPAVKPEPAPQPPATAEAETEGPDLRTKILIGAGVAAALAALGGGGGGTEGSPASTGLTSP